LEAQRVEERSEKTQVACCARTGGFVNQAVIESSAAIIIKVPFICVVHTLLKKWQILY
jgi:protease II